jgi:RNA polymerase sigma-70 factor (ECF subfamily)
VSDYTDNELVNLTLDKDKEFFSELVTRYYPKLRRYLTRLLNGHAPDVDECLSETFLKAYINIATYTPGLTFSAWIYRIAHNQAVDHIRKSSRRQTVELEEHHAPTDTTVRDEERDAVERILVHLSPDDRDLLTLYYFEELSLDEISDIFKIRSNTLAARIKRMRERIKKSYNKPFYGS